MRGCDCTPRKIRARLAEDRASLSDLAAGYTARANEAARLLRLAMRADINPEEAESFYEDAEAWLEGNRLSGAELGS